MSPRIPDIAHDRGAVRLIRPERIADERGWFAESYNAARFAGLGIDIAFCQDNHVKSGPAGVLRGLHFQRPPHGQAKLVRCVHGRIWDVAADIRSGSPTHGRWVATELSAESGLQLFLPIGFAHGYITLESECEVEYKVSDFHSPDCEGGLIWDDPTLAISWPAPAGTPILSHKDRRLPRLEEFTSPFSYDGRPLAPLEPLG